jgi:hypothetical protein
MNNDAVVIFVPQNLTGVPSSILGSVKSSGILKSDV